MTESDTSIAGSDAAHQAEQLRAWLKARAPFHRFQAEEVTRHLTRCVEEWGVSQRWTARREAPSCAKPAEGRPPRQGYLDVKFYRPGMSAVAVEIDRGNKRWSLEKLEAEAANGACALWLRWSARPSTISPPAGVGLVELRVLRHRRPGNQPQLYSLA
ncbi:hypothetical protein [Streptomyces sp. NPDC053427]|uniref:hypothetical protein n=1 Tax=Streptomyces sp. NPDC053427 TaxID=3365701 RepID=UPI0037CD1053